MIDLNQAQPHVPADLRLALNQGIDLKAAARQALTMEVPKLDTTKTPLAPVMPEPGKIICLGLNYYDHAKEGGRDKPSYPWFFMRCATSLMAHGEPAILPRVSKTFDYEAELAVVIGKRARHVTREQALEYVFGYTCFNDMSVRDYQKRTPQWTIGKNFDSTGGFGPVLVTADELPAGAAGLRIQCRLNGQVVQDANTSDMIFGVAETIELLTECMTLEPGDVIVMGTPAGVGFARTPPLWMKVGDVVEVEIEGIGTLVNQVNDEALIC
ncbi:MAG: fumarylacetoacetate hydrolase family protein [Gallionellaceae bacterium]|nr:fumarylacetoacetate hydrolase family protein [Gallionellaceae bacterium]